MFLNSKNLSGWKQIILYTAKTKHVLRSSAPIFGVELKRKYFFCLFFKIGLCSAISFKRSRGGLSTDVAEHTSISKNHRNSYNTRLVSHLKEVVFPNTAGLVLLCAARKTLSNKISRDRIFLFYFIFFMTRYSVHPKSFPQNANDNNVITQNDPKQCFQYINQRKCTTHQNCSIDWMSKNYCRKYVPWNMFSTIIFSRPNMLY